MSFAYGSSVVVVGELVYATDRVTGLWVIDISDPHNPQALGSFDTPGYPTDVAVLDTFAYVADGSGSGLRIISIADPRRPYELGFIIPSVQGTNGVAVSGHYAFVAAGLSLRVVDVSNPDSLVEAGFRGLPFRGNGNGVALAGGYAYVADGDAGLQIVEYYGAGVEEERSTPCAPRISPIATIVRGVLFLPASLLSPPSSLLSVDGRKVLDLRPGPNDVRHLSPGVYFVRERGAGARGQGPEAVRKVVIQ